MNIDYLIRWLLITVLICALFCRPYLAAKTFYPASSAFTAEVKLSTESCGPIRAHVVLDFAQSSNRDHPLRRPILMPFRVRVFVALRFECGTLGVLRSGILTKMFKSPTIPSKSKSVLMPFPFKLQGR